MAAKTKRAGAADFLGDIFIGLYTPKTGFFEQTSGPADGSGLSRLIHPATNTSSCAIVNLEEDEY